MTRPSEAQPPSTPPGNGETQSAPNPKKPKSTPVEPTFLGFITIPSPPTLGRAEDYEEARKQAVAAGRSATPLSKETNPATTVQLPKRSFWNGVLAAVDNFGNRVIRMIGRK